MGSPLLGSPALGPPTAPELPPALLLGRVSSDATILLRRTLLQLTPPDVQNLWRRLPLGLQLPDATHLSQTLPLGLRPSAAQTLLQQPSPEMPQALPLGLPQGLGLLPAGIRRVDCDPDHHAD